MQAPPLALDDVLEGHPALAHQHVRQVLGDLRQHQVVAQILVEDVLLQVADVNLVWSVAHQVIDRHEGMHRYLRRHFLVLVHQLIQDLLVHHLDRAPERSPRPLKRGPTLPHSRAQPARRHRHLLEYRPSLRSGQTAETRRADRRARAPDPHPAHRRIPVAKAPIAALAYDSAPYRSRPEMGGGAGAYARGIQVHGALTKQLMAPAVLPARNASASLI